MGLIELHDIWAPGQRVRRRSTFRGHRRGISQFRLSGVVAGTSQYWTHSGQATGTRRRGWCTHRCRMETGRRRSRGRAPRVSPSRFSTVPRTVPTLLTNTTVFSAAPNTTTQERPPSGGGRQLQERGHPGSCGGHPSHPHVSGRSPMCGADCSPRSICANAVRGCTGQCQGRCPGSDCQHLSDGVCASARCWSGHDVH